MKDTIYSLFEEAVQNHRSERAIIENNRTMTFGQLSDLVDIIAGSFPKEVHSIGIVMSHRAEMIAAMLAILKCGAMYVPAEPNFPIGRIRYMMEEASVDFVLTDKEYADKLRGFPIRLTDCEICGVETPAQERREIQDPESPAYVLYTSGTTGKPKGVCVRNRNVCHYVRAFENEFHPSSGDVMLQYFVCSFDIFVEEVFASLLNGAALAIPSAQDKENVHTLMKFVEKHQVTIISGFPYLLAEMNHLSEIPSSLRLLISGGDVLRGAYVEHLLGKAEIYNTYGPSETTVCASYYRCNGGTVLPDGTYPIGHPVKGCEVRILDQNGKEVSKGETGEICIYGGGVSCGYIGSIIYFAAVRFYRVEFLFVGRPQFTVFNGIVMHPALFGYVPQVGDCLIDRHIIWGDINLDLEDWREDLKEEYPDSSDDELYQVMYEINADYLYDERANLNIQLSQPIIVIGDIGRWNGRVTGYKMIDSGNIKDCLYSDTDFTEWYVDKYGESFAGLEGKIKIK